MNDFTSLVLSIVMLACICARCADAAVDIRVEGMPAEFDEQLANAIGLNYERDVENLSETRLRLMYRRAPDELRTVLEANGYYTAEITSELERVENGWLATFDITPGDPLLVQAVAVRVSGADEALLTEQAAAFPLGPGDVLVHADYERGKRDLMNLAHELGYFDAVFTRREVRVDLEEYRAVVELEMETGDRYRFGEVSFSDNSLDEAFVRQFLTFAPDDPYLASEVIRLQSTLRDTDYFSVIEVLPDRDSAIDYRVPVEVTLEMKERNRYRAGLGFGTDSGPRGTLGWDNRYVNSHGHRAGAELRLSLRESGISSFYRIPRFRGGGELGFSAGLVHEDTDTAVSDRLELGTQYVLPVWGGNRVLGLRYLVENFEVGEDADTSSLLIPDIGWSRVRSDDPVYPRSGYQVAMNLQGASETIASSLSFLQLTARARIIRGIGERGRLLMRTEFGAMSVSDFEDLPASLRFFAGGDNSVRGFDFEELGPRDETGRVVGGKYLGVASIEYEQMIRGNWGAAVFADGGNAFDELEGDVAWSLGAGLRWLSPVGLVRLDLAAGRVGSDDSFRLHFVIGPDL